MSFLKGLGAPEPEQVKIPKAHTDGHAFLQQNVRPQSSALPSHAKPPRWGCGDVITELVLLLLLIPGMGNKLKSNKKHIQCHPNLKQINVSNFDTPKLL